MLVTKNGYKIIFIHMPKTAGTSIESCLGARVDGGIIKHRHKSLDYILQSEKSDRKDYFVFTVVRNTYERFWSSYLHHIKPDGGIKMSFKDYVHHLKNYHNNPDEYILGDGTLTDDPSTYKPWIYLKGTEPSQVELAGYRISHIQHFEKLDYWISDLDSLDYILHFNSLAKDYEHLKNKFSLGPLVHKGPNPLKFRQQRDGALIRQNNTLQDYRLNYTTELKSIIEEIHGDEIEYFKYEF